VLTTFAHEAAGELITRHSLCPLISGARFEHRPDAKRRGDAEVCFIASSFETPLRGSSGWGCDKRTIWASWWGGALAPSRTV